MADYEHPEANQAEQQFKQDLEALIDDYDDDLADRQLAGLLRTYSDRAEMGKL